MAKELQLVFSMSLVYLFRRLVHCTVLLHGLATTFSTVRRNRVAARKMCRNGGNMRIVAPMDIELKSTNYSVLIEYLHDRFITCARIESVNYLLVAF